MKTLTGKKIIKVRRFIKWKNKRPRSSMGINLDDRIHISMIQDGRWFIKNIVGQTEFTRLIQLAINNECITQVSTHHRSTPALLHRVLERIQRN